MTTSYLRPINTKLLAGAFFVVFVGVLSHFLFSWMGFNPTDEGFTLAHSRRLLDGQIPHRDFIVIRPFFSPLIHLPGLLFGGAYTFWLSRLFVWCELAAIAWLWTSVINRLSGLPFSINQKLAVALIAFAATTHTKHITAWHSIDGLFFIAIGTYLCIRGKRASRFAGYLLLGLAPLCKQSFIFVAPLTLFILNDWRKPKYWLAVATPGFCYLAYLVVARALPDAWIQLTAHQELLTVGVKQFLSKRMALSFIAGCLAALAWRRTASIGKAHALVWLGTFYFGSLMLTAIALWFGVMVGGAFGLFGFLAGATLCLQAAGKLTPDKRTASLLVLVSAWSVSLSGGYNSPALMAGPLVAVLIAWTLSIYPRQFPVRYSLPLAAIVIALCFGIARTKYIYRDRSAANLTQHLESVLPGARHVYTNPNTFAFMTDLNKAVQFVKGQHKQYAILPDTAAHWVTATQPNPLPAVWPHADELAARPLMDRFIKAMEARRTDTIFIVQKVEAKDLARGFVALPNSDYYEVVRYARTHFTKIHETDYFELYR